MRALFVFLAVALMSVAYAQYNSVYGQGQQPYQFRVSLLGDLISYFAENSLDNLEIFSYFFIQL